MSMSNYPIRHEGKDYLPDGRATYEPPKPGDTLGCGHACPESESQFSAGYGVVETDQGKQTYCYSCCTELDKAAIRQGVPQFLYLTKKELNKQGARYYRLTNWQGAEVLHLTDVWVTDHNIGGSLYRVRAVDDTGRKWYGTGPGPRGNGEYVRLRRLGDKKRKEVSA